jgi:hypothetical protein
MLVDGLHKGVDSLRPHVRIDAVTQVSNPTASCTELLCHLRYLRLDGLVRSVEAARVQITLHRKKEFKLYLGSSRYLPAVF